MLYVCLLYVFYYTGIMKNKQSSTEREDEKFLVAF